MNESSKLSEGVLSAAPPNDLLSSVSDMSDAADASQGEIVAALAPWGSDAAGDRTLIARTVSGAVGRYWPDDPHEIARTVERVCRAVVARLSRTGADDWSIVDFGPGHGIAGLSVSSEHALSPDSSPQSRWATVVDDPANETSPSVALTSYVDNPTLMIAINVWELDVVTDDETADDHQRWMQTVTTRLRAILGHLGDELGVDPILRQSSGRSPFPYQRQELVVLRPLPCQESDIVEIVLACARLVEASLLVYTLVEERARAS